MKRLIVFDLDGTLAAKQIAARRRNGDAARPPPRGRQSRGDLRRSLDAIRKAGAVLSSRRRPPEEPVAAAHLRDKILSGATAPGRNCTRRISVRTRKQKIIGALNKALDQSGIKTGRHWGEVIEDRGSQITFSALGQEAPLDEKKAWDPDFKKREKIKAILDPLIPEFSVNLGGSTSIDVTKPGIDKAYGIRKLRDTLGIAIKDMIFVGDAIFPGGNDYPAKQAGVVSIEVRDPDETKRVIEAIIACLDGEVGR